MSPPAENEVNRRIGAWLMAQRQARGLTFVELAKRIGVSRQQLMKYEQGLNAIRPHRLMRIASVLDCDPAGALRAAAESQDLGP